MPCYTVQRMSVAFRADNRPLLLQAIKTLGWIVQEEGNTVKVRPSAYDTPIRLDLAAGTASLEQRQQPQLNALKRAYSAEALRLVASRNQWSKTGTTTGYMTKY